MWMQKRTDRLHNAQGVLLIIIGVACLLITGCGEYDITDIFTSNKSDNAPFSGTSSAAPVAPPAVVQADGPDVFTVGVAFPLTGVSSGLGGNMTKGAELAVDEVNASTLLVGMNLRLVFEDTGGTADGAEAAFRKLIDEDAVRAIIGPWSSSSTKRTAQVANASGVVAISPTSAASPSGITAPGDFIFRTSLTVDNLVPEGIRITKNALSYSKVATIVNEDDTFSMSSNNTILEELMKQEYADVEVVARQTFRRAKNDPLPDLVDPLSAIRASGADVVFISALSPGRQGVIVKAREMGIHAPLIIPALTVTDVVEAEMHLTRSTENAVTVTNWADDSTMRSMAFVRNYMARYGENADAYSARAYAATRILAAAIARASTTSSDAIRTALQMINGPETSLDTIFGTFYFDENGDGVYRPVVRVVRDGRLTVLE